LKALGSNLLVSTEKPEIFIPKLLMASANNVVVYQREECDEEYRIETALYDKLQNKAKSRKISLDV
jgi:hypothetical protein